MFTMRQVASTITSHLCLTLSSFPHGHYIISLEDPFIVINRFFVSGSTVQNVLGALLLFRKAQALFTELLCSKPPNLAERADE